MVYAQRGPKTTHTERMRKKGGQYLKALRTKRGLTQRALADRLGLEYYTFISQMEVGHARVPTELYPKMAEVLGVPRAEFARHMLKFYDPVVYNEIFGAGAEDQPTDAEPEPVEALPDPSPKRRSRQAKKKASLPDTP